MADTLIVFGKVYTNVTGIKATDDNDIILSFERIPDGNNMSFGYTDVPLPYVGIAKVGQAVI